MKDFLTAIALALTFEGVAYALFPQGMKRMMAEMQRIPEKALRMSGLIAVIAGVMIVWAIRNA